MAKSGKKLFSKLASSKDGQSMEEPKSSGGSREQSFERLTLTLDKIMRVCVRLY